MQVGSPQLGAHLQAKRFSTYLGEDNQKTGLTTGTVSDNDELSAKFRHDSGECMVCKREDPKRQTLMGVCRCVRCGKGRARDSLGIEQ